MLDAYLDGTLSESERARFETVLAGDASLRAQIEAQSRLDISLARMFSDSGAAAAVALTGTRSSRWSSGWLVAAAIVLAGLGVILSAARPLLFAGPSVLETAYRSQIDRGFKPDVVCTTPEAFASWMETYFGQPLYPADAKGVQLVGWAYAPVVSSRSGVLLARVHDTPVIVVVDHSVRDKQQLSVPESAGLNRFRAQIGSVVLYEVTPLETASILPLLSANR
jgi:hypothetical protein